MISRIKISNPKSLAQPAGAYSHVARVKANGLPVFDRLASEEMLLEISVIAALD